VLLAVAVNVLVRFAPAKGLFERVRSAFG